MQASRRGEVTLGTAVGGIVGAPVLVGSDRWRLRIDGNAIKATYRPRGFFVKMK